MVVQWWRNDAHLLVKRGIIPGRIESSVIVQGSSVRESFGRVHKCARVVVVPVPMVKSVRVLLGACAACSHRR